MLIAEEKLPFRAKVLSSVITDNIDITEINFISQQKGQWWTSPYYYSFKS